MLIISKIINLKINFQSFQYKILTNELLEIFNLISIFLKSIYDLKFCALLGVFLHVLADTLGSVAVIISSLLIYYFGWNWTDPFCSLLLACLIIASVIPLLRGSAQMLSQCSPGEIEHEFEEALDKVLKRSFSSVSSILT